MDTVPYSDRGSISGHIEAALTLLRVAEADLVAEEESTQLYWQLRGAITDACRLVEATMAYSRRWIDT